MNQTEKIGERTVASLDGNLSGVSSGKPTRNKQQKAARERADDSASEKPATVVVRLFQSVTTITGIVAGINHAEGAKSSADYRMSLNDVRSDIPKMSSSRSRIVGINGSHQATQGILSAQQNNAAEH